MWRFFRRAAFSTGFNRFFYLRAPPDLLRLLKHSSRLHADAVAPGYRLPDVVFAPSSDDEPAQIKGQGSAGPETSKQLELVKTRRG